MLKVADDDPRKCQVPGCNLMIEGSGKYCGRHGGDRSSIYIRLAQHHRDELANYQETRVKTLKDEIALIRMLITTKMNSAHDDYELNVIAPQVAQLIDSVSKLMIAESKLQESMNNTLDRDMAMNLIDTILVVINKYIQDPDDMKEFTNELFATLQQQ